MFDPKKLIEAAKAASQTKPVPVTIPGIGAAFKRKLTVADVEIAGSVRERLETSGKFNRTMSMAVGLAQAICGPDGEAVFDVNNDDHLAILSAIPWESVRDVAMGDEGKA